MDERFSFLLQRYSSGQLTPAEWEEFMQAAEFKEQFTQKIEQDLLARIGETASIPEEQLQASLQRIMAADKPPASGKPGVRLLKTAWLRYAAAVILLFGIGMYVYLAKKPQKDSVLIQPADVSPGSNKAVLTLADGSNIILDNAAAGTLAMQGNTRIIKLNTGALAYSEGANTGEILYNTISTPKGGQYQITLPDGTHAWLNAASSIKFPTAFRGTERRVEVKGEVYLEVKTDSRLPFNVSVNETVIRVLGTSFNVNAYTDEPAINTTLIDGAVSINAYNRLQVLKPGQQAQVSRQQIKLVNNVNIEKVIAWKNGVFNFEDASLQEVMRQIERWYDIEVVYEKNIPAINFVGKIKKNLTLAQLLHFLEQSEVHFRIEQGRRLVVLP